MPGSCFVALSRTHELQAAVLAVAIYEKGGSVEQRFLTPFLPSCSSRLSAQGLEKSPLEPHGHCVQEKLLSGDPGSIRRWLSSPGAA